MIRWRRLSACGEDQGARPQRVLTGEHALSLIREACKQRVVGSLILPDEALAYPARFAFAGEDSLEVEVITREEVFFRSSSGCLLAFSVSSCAFATFVLVREFHDERGIRLSFDMPTHIWGTEMRQWFRVPVLAASGLTARLYVQEGVPEYPQALNISLGGVLLEFEPDQCPQLKPGATVTVEFLMADECVGCAAEVRRRQGFRFGLHFTEDMHNNERFKAMVCEAERCWLKLQAPLTAEEEDWEIVEEEA